MNSLLLVLLACSGPDTNDTAVDYVGPTLVHTPPAGVVEGTPVVLTVTATDDDGVARVELVHRRHGDADWSTLPMASGADDAYTAELDGDLVQEPSVEYYFKATDGAEQASTSYLPAASTSDPFVLPVSVEGIPLPFVETFEGVTGEEDLSALGWGSASTNFRGYPWQVSDAQAHGGARSAYHPRGYPDTQPLQDFLISPAIDLSAAADAQLTWWEYGAGTEDAAHALYVSVGSRDPADGDYVLVTSLVAPSEGAWSRSAVVDLTAWVGTAAVYLGWYFEGVDADDWWVDDIRVEPRQADLVYTWSVAPSPLHPGDAGTLTVHVENLADVAATDAVVSASFPSGGATFDTSTVTLGAVAGGGSADAVFPLEVDTSTPDNSYVPMDLQLSWGSAELGGTERLLVGTASVAHVEVSNSATGLVELSLGVGDPDAPAWEIPLLQEVVGAGNLVFDVDITDARDFLPPAAGEHRWFLRGHTAVASVVGAFTIADDGVDYSATVLPQGLPEGDFLAWIPEPPTLGVGATSNPSAIDPGTSGISMTLTVTNSGAATTGSLSATLVSDDPDVVVTDSGPLNLGVLGAGSRTTISGFAFDVSSAHLDSSDVRLHLELADSLESWEVPVAFAVPFPVLRVTSVEIDDDGRDGVLDGDESADLTFHVTNVGDESTVGTVTGSLSVESSSTASASATTNSESFGTLSAGATGDSRDFTVTVTGGAAGETVDLLLSLEDGARVYEARTRLVLSEPPWQALTTIDDTAGDALDGWDFDILRGEYRVLDGVLQLRLYSDTVFDPDALFIEAWGNSVGADWLYYRLVLQSGRADLQGYDPYVGFLPIAEPAVSQPDANSVQFDMVLDEMGLFLDELSIGIGTGWCGPPEYYCDQYPDNWGYPYYAFSTAGWYSMTW